MSAALSENPASVIHSLNLAHNSLDNQGTTKRQHDEPEVHVQDGNTTAVIMTLIVVQKWLLVFMWMFFSDSEFSHSFSSSCVPSCCRCVQLNPAGMSPQQGAPSPQPLQDLPHLQRFRPSLSLSVSSKCGLTHSFFKSLMVTWGGGTRGSQMLTYCLKPGAGLQAACFLLLSQLTLYPAENLNITLKQILWSHYIQIPAADAAEVYK